MISIQGTAVSEGIKIGPLHFVQPGEMRFRRCGNVDRHAEWGRFLAARKEAVRQLDRIAVRTEREAAADAAEIFRAQQAILWDPLLEEGIREQILESGQNAEAAVHDTSAAFAKAFSGMDSPEMQAKADDIRDVSFRLLAVLTGGSLLAISSEVPVILAAEDLTPGEFIQLDRDKLLGLVLKNGSPYGHTAILARTMGIPAVFGAGEALKWEYEGKEGILDGSAGMLVIEADEHTRLDLRSRQEAQIQRQEMLRKLQGLPNETRDGHRVAVYCNIDGPEDLPAVQRNDGGGIGLYRSEFLFLGRQDLPSEEEQFEAYKKVLLAMEEREVIIRTLDIGLDKLSGNFERSRADHPSPENRGLRFSLNHPELFRTQLRALYRASAYGRLNVMFPMVNDVEEVRTAKEFCRQARTELQAEGIPYGSHVEIGVMIETPSAALTSDALAKEADFFSCGTNDLTQFTLAADRLEADPAHSYQTHHPAVLRLLRLVCENAHRNGIRVGICGEMAADPDMTETLLSIGIDEFSVPPGSVLRLREQIRNTDLSKTLHHSREGQE